MQRHTKSQTALAPAAQTLVTEGDEHEPAPNPLRNTGPLDAAGPVVAADTADQRTQAAAAGRTTTPPVPPRRPTRTPLRRLPTELVLTTRLPPVPARTTRAARVSGVVPVRSPSPAAPQRGSTAAEMAKTIVPSVPQSSQPPAPRRAESQSAADPLALAQKQTAMALDRARQSEQRARVAEMRALWAERQARPRNAEDQRRQQRQDRRNSILYGVLWLGLVSLVIGGYVSLLGPVRQRLASQAAQIQELIRERDQLRHANQQLAVQVETLTAPLQR